MRLHKFNKEKALNKLRFNLNKGIYIKTSSIIISIVLIISFIMIFTFAKFSTTNKYNIIQTTVGDFSTKDYLVGYYVDDIKQSTLPLSSTNYVVKKIECNNGSALWDEGNATGSVYCVPEAIWGFTDVFEDSGGFN